MPGYVYDGAGNRKTIAFLAGFDAAGAKKSVVSGWIYDSAGNRRQFIGGALIVANEPEHPF